MIAEVEEALSLFLEAFPYQVRTWDARVIEQMASQPHVFAAFKAGNEATKWKIYIAMRVAGGLARSAA